MDEVKRAKVEGGELSRGVKPWEQDPYGVGEVLQGKTSVRGWTTAREQEFWKQAVVAAGLAGRNDVTSFLEWLRGQPQEGCTYPCTLPWS